VKDELQRLDGVGQVDVYGASDREIQVLIDPRKLEAYNITYQQILDIVDSQNINTPGGRVNEKGVELTVRTIGKYKDVQDIKNIIVANKDNQHSLISGQFAELSLVHSLQILFFDLLS